MILLIDSKDGRGKGDWYEKIQNYLNSKIIIVWERAYYNDKQKTIDKILDIINNKTIKYIELNGD